MARKLQTNPLDGRTARAALRAKDGGEPHWFRLQRKPALYLGYRKLTPAGSWIARWRLNGSYKERVIGTADDAREADGLAVLSFDQATAKARAELEQAVNPRPQAAQETRTEAKSPMLVRDALATYVANVRASSGDAEAERADGRFANHVLPYIGETAIIDLGAGDLRQVRDRMLRRDANNPNVERASKSTANRTMATVKAALTMAFKAAAEYAEQHKQKTLIPSDSAWRRCERFRDVDGQRELHLDDGQIERLVNACRPDLRNLVLAGILTGARPGKELRIMRCRDFSADMMQVTVCDGKTGSRTITLTQDGVDLFTQLTAGRAPDDFIFKNDRGQPWALDGHVRPFKEAVRRAGLPDEAVAYNLRHAYISHCIMNGAAVDLIARNCGTSIAMVEKFYTKWFARKRQAMIEAAAPKFRIVGGNVATLRATA